MSQSQPEFPIDVLPTRVLLFVLEVSEALVVDPGVVAGPCLATIAGCIGNRRRIIVKPGSWVEPAVLWMALILPSGGKKTPALTAVVEHLTEKEAAEIEKATARQREYEEELEAWKGKAHSKRGKLPKKPPPPNRLVVSDITVEGLLSVHAEAPLGLLVYRDELGGWLRSYNQYKARGQGGDAQTWCEMHQGKPALVDRKRDAPLSVPRASVSIVGGIQPKLLREALSGEHLFDGIASRFLFMLPEESVKAWTEETISEETREGWTDLLDELLALRPNEKGEPIDLPMTAKAKEIWVMDYNARAQRIAEAEGAFRSTLSKLEAATARFALVIQLADDPQATEVGVKAMRAAVKISKWFEAQALRVYQEIAESEDERDRRELCEWIAKRGGNTITRDVARYGPNRFRKRAREALNDLVAAGLAQTRPRSKSKTPEYVLCDHDTSEGEAQ